MPPCSTRGIRHKTWAPKRPDQNRLQPGTMVQQTNRGYPIQTFALPTAFTRIEVVCEVYTQHLAPNSSPHHKNKTIRSNSKHSHGCNLPAQYTKYNQVSPSIPSIPSMPSMPSILSIPSIPSMPSIPPRMFKYNNNNYYLVTPM